MNQKILKLASELLKMAADDFAEHGCNDLPDSPFFEDWTKDELVEFTKSYEDWNSNGTEFNPNHLYLPDYAVMGYVAELLSKEQGVQESDTTKMPNEQKPD